MVLNDLVENDRKLKFIKQSRALLNAYWSTFKWDTFDFSTV